MGVRVLNPTTPGRRGMEVSDFAEITTDRPNKRLTSGKAATGGRNVYGRITSRFRGGGHKRRYRAIDFKRDKIGVPGTVETIEYDPNRTARIALVRYADGERRYIPAPKGLAVGARVVAGDAKTPAPIEPGCSLPLARIPLGSVVHCVELTPGRGAALARSAGTSIQVLALEAGTAVLRLPSGELRRVDERCRATIGLVGNEEHENISIGKAGRKRWLGRMPHNRGASMNPVDHPHGGGEGKSPQGNPHPVSPWGWHTKGLKTRNPRKASWKLILQRRKK